MEAINVYYDEDRFDRVVPCQLDRSVIDGLDEGGWLCGRLLCHRRLRWLGRMLARVGLVKEYEYGLVYVGAEAPGYGFLRRVQPFFTDGAALVGAGGQAVHLRIYGRLGEIKGALF